MIRRGIVSAVAALLLHPLFAQDAPAAKPAYTTNPKFVSLLAEAKQQKRERRYDFAIDSYKKANKLAEGKCSECLVGMYELQMGIGSFKDGLASANQLQALALTPRDKSTAEFRVGEAMLKQAGDKPKPAQLEAAHNVLAAAVTDNPHNNSARWSDACVLARMGKNDDASKAFAECAKLAPSYDPMRVRAQHFAEDPTLSLHKMAPAFEVTALDGTRFNLDNMGGKVVLVDFWATWCGPCNEELPNVKKIARDFKGEPLAIISISWDSDETKWKDFINKNEMTWLQYRDADHKLSERFGVNAIPHYFTIDSDGVLTAEMLGSGNDVEGKLKKLVKRAREAKSGTQTTAQTAAQTMGTN